MSDELEAPAGAANSGEGTRKKRRRRRRKKRPAGTPAGTSSEPRPRSASSLPPPPPLQEQGRVGNRGRRQVVVVEDVHASPPASGRNPHRKRNSRARRASPASVPVRRRKLRASDTEVLSEWLDGMPDGLLANLYKGLGGQPRRVPNRSRLIQLAVRAVVQGGRLEALVRQLHERERKALAGLLQCGGLAHNTEFHRTLVLAFGGHEREWEKALRGLAERGLVAASGQEDAFFYIVPDPLIDGLVAVMEADLGVPTFHHDEMRVIEHQPFCPPLDHTLTSLATYIDQYGLRLTQRHDVHRHDKEALDHFFGQVWEADGELFQLHLDFLLMHEMVTLAGEGLRLDRDTMEEFLQLEPEDQRDLIFRALNRRFELAEWVLWAVHGAGDGWVAERPLTALYRHWMRGREWEKRFKQGVIASPRSGERDSFSFAPLVQSGLLELGQWGQEKFYRLTPRAQSLLEPAADDGFRQFYLTPDFKVAAPAGLAPILLFRIGEIAEFKGCDRANSYLITEASIERALEAGWKRDDVLQFLRDNSAYEIPENVEQTLKGWIGHRGDVEFHDLMLVTVHRSQVRRLESNKRIKPYILHRFAPGLYAIDRARKSEVEAALEQSGFSPAREVRNYPGTAEAVEARANLFKALAEAREQAQEPMRRRVGVVDPSQLQALPGVNVRALGSRARKNEAETPPPEVTLDEVHQLVDEALNGEKGLEMVYLARTGQRLDCIVRPQRLAFKDGVAMLVGLDLGSNERRSFMLERIERLRIAEEDG